MRNLDIRKKPMSLISSLENIWVPFESHYANTFLSQSSAFQYKDDNYNENNN